MRPVIAAALVLVAALAATVQPAHALTIRDVIELTRAGLTDDVLVALIEVDGGVYSTDTATLKSLKDAGVSPRVMIALIRSGRDRRVEEPPSEPVEGPCWSEFGGNPQRTLARTQLDLGRPKAKPVWVRGVGSYMEYPPSFCDGTVYVNTFGGRTAAYEAETGRLIWSWQSGTKASSPAIAGDYLVVSSHDGSITGLDRARGKVRWRIETHAKVESSPVAMDGIVYVGSTDGRLFALNAANGHVRWAYDTGGRINSSPSLAQGRVCVTTYAGSIFCVRQRDGRKLWST